MQEDRTVHLAKGLHPPTSPWAPSTSDNNVKYNLEETLAQIQATMAVGFTSLLQYITTLRSQITALTTSNQAQTMEIQSLTTTI